MSREHAPDPPPTPRGPGTTAADVEAAFRDAIKAHACPACRAAFTDGAVDWGHAWREGYVDAVHDQGWMIRDGPFKLRCASCGKRAWYHVFGSRVEPAEERA